MSEIRNLVDEEFSENPSVKRMLDTLIDHIATTSNMCVRGKVCAISVDHYEYLLTGRVGGYVASQRDYDLTYCTWAWGIDSDGKAHLELGHYDIPEHLLAIHDLHTRTSVRANDYLTIEVED